MGLPNYQITVFSPLDGSTQVILDGAAFDECKYSRVLNGIGALALTLPDDPDWPTIFTLDSLIEIQRTSALTGFLQTEETYLTRLTHRFRDGDQEKFIVGALSLNHLLSRRVIDPTDDASAAGGYSTKAGPADDVMFGYAEDQCGSLTSADRQFPNFTVGATGSLGTAVGRRLRYDNLLETFQDIANASNIDFIITRLIANTLRLTIAPIGTDRSRSRNYPGAPFVELNPLRGNLSEPSLLFDRKEEQNYIYAFGQGPGESRIVSELSGVGISDSPYNRIEFTVDIRTAERGDTTTILTGARNALYEKQAHKEFTFKPLGTEPGNVYRNDWDVGDIITAVYGDEIVDLRVREVEITLSNDGEDIVPKLLPV